MSNFPDLRNPTSQRPQFEMPVIAHDLRTLLGGAMAIARDLEESPRLARLEEERELTRLLRDQLAHVLLFLEDLIALQSPHLSEPQCFNLREMVLMLVSMLRPPNAVRVETGPDATPISTWKFDLFRVLLNLASNGISAMLPKGGTLTIVWSQQPGLLILSVSDTGLGMAPHIAERLVRASPAEQLIAREELGLSNPPSLKEGSVVCKGSHGLGLGIVQEILANRGGTLSLESNPGKGTVIQIIWPL